MQPYQQNFIQFLINQNALLFGSYELKSGRISPYFFNAGQFNTGAVLTQLGRFYADAIIASGIEYDMLYGPAYKAISIVSSTAIALYETYQIDIPFCFNRKEHKPYGEGGNLIGAPLKGKVLIIDDVVSAGTTFRESAQLIADYPAEMVGVVTALDRQEKGTGELSAIDEINQVFNIETINIIKLEHIIEFLKSKNQYDKELKAILTYQDQYGS